MSAHARARAAATAVAAILLVTSACVMTGRRPDGDERVAPETRPDGGTVHQTNAVSTLDRETLDQMRVGRIEEMLVGRIPGLEVLQTSGGDFTLRIRGRNSLFGDDEPLVVLDGMPLRAGGVSRSLAAISPNDVARIEVLKDAGATAFYGIRGANGVILITTKRTR